MATKKKPGALAAEVSDPAYATLTRYYADTLMGHVSLRNAQVEGKTTEELRTLLTTDEYLSRIQAHSIYKVTEEPILTPWTTT